jgi:hypothetical protein
LLSRQKCRQTPGGVCVREDDGMGKAEKVRVCRCTGYARHRGSTFLYLPSCPSPCWELLLASKKHPFYRCTSTNPSTTSSALSPGSKK